MDRIARDDRSAKTQSGRQRSSAPFVLEFLWSTAEMIQINAALNLNAWHLVRPRTYVELKWDSHNRCRAKKSSCPWPTCSLIKKPE